MARGHNNTTMKKQIFNPYLPSYEYVPDGEPHVFGDRVYVYGSHDRFAGGNFCQNDYITYSAPVTDLKDWRFEGYIWWKKLDPGNSGHDSFYAPDVCQGPDGRYYIYYAPAPGFTLKSWYIRCAVSDSPAGPFAYLGEVKIDKWKKTYIPFDPAVYVEDGHVYLYWGSALFYPVLGASKKTVLGGGVVELDKDMLTPIGEPKTTMLSKDKDPSLGGHGFFEASSMRKFGDKYYFIYSSLNGHELCYGIGENPMGPFEYCGVLVSNGDVGLRGIQGPKDACDFTGNTHGSIEYINGKYYVFYHRHTNRHDFARQDCAEEIFMDENGRFAQVERTSCGLNGGPLEGTGEYEARIACCLKKKGGNRFYGVFRGLAGKEPFITQTGKDREDNGDQYIANIHDGTTIGYKYFDLRETKEVAVNIKGNAKGKLHIKATEDGEDIGVIDLAAGNSAPIAAGSEKSGLYFVYEGAGKFDFISFELK